MLSMYFNFDILETVELHLILLSLENTGVLSLVYYALKTVYSVLLKLTLREKLLE